MKFMFKFTFKTGIRLVIAATITTLVAIGAACQLSCAERTRRANAETQTQPVRAKLGVLVGVWRGAAGDSCRVFMPGKDLLSAASAPRQGAF